MRIFSCFLALTVASVAAQENRPRARDLGLAPGVFTPGSGNAITDVAGVTVGHVTLNQGDNVRTGVTVIVPHQGNVFQDKVPGAVFVGNAFGKPGITVDTHFGRLARRLGWTEETDPVKVEHAVGALFPKRDWTMLSHHLIWHGRRRCHAKKPACGACPVARLCPSFGAGPTDPVEAEKLVTTQGPA